MGYSLRILLIDKHDKIKRIPLTRFDRIRKRDPKEAIPDFKHARIRYVEVVVELENRKPFQIARMVYRYLKFDSNGQMDELFHDTETQVAIRMLPAMSLIKNSDKVINASDRFAERRFIHDYTWTPSQELEIAIIDNIFE